MITLTSTSWASRVPEIEEYFVARATNILRTRFPDKPFLVFVKVNTDTENAGRRQPASTKRRGDTSTRLPYLEIDEEEPDIWNRTDIPLGTLINYVRNVKVKIQIDSSVNEEEMKELQAQLVTQLNLAPDVDSIEITKMEWGAAERSEKLRTSVVLGTVAVLLLFGLLYALSRLSIISLVKGLSKPIAEIGKSTQAFANSALNMVTEKQHIERNVSDSESTENEDEKLNLGANLLEIRKGSLELLNRNKDLFANPDAEVLSFIERKGEQNPAQMGAILAELSETELKTLFKYGKGNWWFVALSHPQPMTPAALAILNEIDRLRLRRNFTDRTQMNISDQLRHAGLTFGRMNAEDLVSVLAGIPIEKCEPIIDLLPRDLALAVSKKLFPGQWAALLDSNRRPKPIDIKILETLEKKAHQAFPLRDEKLIKEFFNELDISRYLDSASPRDEKDFYMVLPPDSRIILERFPFYRIFEAQDEVKKIMGPNLLPKEWALAFSDCERSEIESLLLGFNQRQAFLIKEELQKLKNETPEKNKISHARRKAVNSYLNSVDVFNSQQAKAPLNETQKAETSKNKDAA